MTDRLLRWLRDMPLKGPLTVYGLSIALAAFLVDRLSKWWLIDIFGIAERGIVTILPFFDLVMAWEPGHFLRSVSGRYGARGRSVGGVRDCRDRRAHALVGAH